MIPLHGIATREDLPLPFPLVVAAAAAVLVVTFWILLFAWREPRYRRRTGRELPRLGKFIDSPAFSRPLRMAAGAVWLVAAVALALGADRIDNPVFGFVFVWLWVGLVPVALLFGAVYRRTNPARLLLRLTGTTDAPARQNLDSRLPAALALLVFLYAELVEPLSLTLPVLRGFAALWLAWALLGTMATSREWIERADPFESFATTVAQLSPWSRSASGTLMIINPLRNLAAWQAPKHQTALAVVLLSGTLFDAVAASAWWVKLTQASDISPRVLGSLGLLGTVAVIGGLFLLCALPLRPPERGLLPTADRLAPSLVPLIAGYFLAHYATMLYLEGQRTAIRFADPLGLGWDLFGLAESGPDTTLLAYPMLVAVVQVLLIVGGHVAAALVCHDIALRGAHAASAVLRQTPMLVFMVGLTIAGMLLMFGQ
ncbi:hypothetical protein LKO27_05100 [Tessaracoccus sp. OS52]|uniref:hypothetical protein n=1 Tax=Tessaracoccus sp. OS52 TaxID=2886691 RepID=UPI001D114E68|nr:hypothetical protein [Tessaracoccus sp. OS52]MCC2592793.1 hypothetical protein [Tessaracoccus sp. OS52]